MKMCRDLHRQLLLLLLVCQYRIQAKGILFNSDIKLDLKTRQYNDIVVIVGDNHDQANCQEILQELQATLVGASRRVHGLLGGRGLLGRVEVQLPGGWDQETCGTTLHTSHHTGTGDLALSVSGQLTTFQSAAECGARSEGDYIQLPHAVNTSAAAAPQLAAAFLQLMYGVWDTSGLPGTEDTEAAEDAARQQARCWGRTAAEVIFSHPDFTLARDRAAPVNWSAPVVRHTRYSPPRYVLVLENSAMMGSQWDLVRTVVKNLILEPEYLPAAAQLGLVMFNSAAYTEHPLVPLTPAARQSVSLSIRSKHNLSPSTESCAACGLATAVETLHGGPGVVILISRGAATSAAASGGGDMWSLAAKHQLRVFSVTIPPLGQRVPQLQLQPGDSFLINATASFLAQYTECLHATDTILRSTLRSYRAVIHEASYEPFVSGENNVDGRFIIDQYAGTNTTFKVYFTDIVESYIKSISVRSEQGDTFNTIMDNKINLHYYSLYEVPFTAGSGWSYAISRLSSPAHSNTHIVRVTSASRPGADISVDVWTRAVAGRGGGARATVLYARVLHAQQPVVNSTVVCSTARGGYSVQLLDTGGGDPDTARGDGVHSRYLQYLLPGTHSLSCAVYGRRSYVVEAATVRRLDQFTRTLCCVSVTLAAADVSVTAPPARILDLGVTVVTAQQQLTLRWTAPGDDYDWGKLASYQLFTSPSRAAYTRARNTSAAGAVLLQSFSAGQQAGLAEQHTVRVNMFDQEMFYVLVPVDSEGNIGEMSNIVTAYMPRPQILGEPGAGTNTPLREGLFDPMRRPTEPNLVIMYVIVGIVCIVIFTFIVIVTVIIVIRNKTNCDSTSSLHPHTASSGLSHTQSKETISGISEYKLSMGGDTGDCLDIFNHLPSTQDTLHQHTYVPGYQTSPTYAKPVPKSLRKAKGQQEPGLGPATSLGPAADKMKHVIIREAGDGEEEGGAEFPSSCAAHRDVVITSDYARISTLKKVPPPTLPKPSCKPDILSSNYSSSYSVRNITTV